jgi:hypothetical protein
MKRILTSLVCTLPLILHTQASEIFSEDFSYPDGPLASGSSGVWATHSGTADQISVSSGRIELTESNTEDVNVTLPGQPYADGTLYASFSVSFSEVPSGDGTFLAHFKDGGNGFRGRVFATGIGAETGSLRLGVGNASGSTPATVIPVDLTLDTPYTVVLRYDLDTASSTLWVDPLSEADMTQGVSAEDSATAITVTSFAFRQARTSGHGMGTLMVDDLRIGSSFSQVTPVPEPSTYALGMGGGLLLLLMRRRWRRR